MKRIDNREFVIAYVRSETREEVAKAMELSIAGVNSKAYYLRKAGVNLPKKFKKGGLTKLDISQLNSLIAKHLKQA